MAERRYLFVSGCPRSGTTMITTLLNWSDDAFVAQERYAPLLRRDPDALVPSLFRAERLLDFRRGECGYASFQAKREYTYQVANPKDFDALDRYPVIGDKITHLFRRFELFGTPAWRDEDVTIVHVVRGLEGVAASYLARQRNADDKWEWGVDDALRDWTDAVECAHAYHQDAGRGTRLVLVDYDWMHGGDANRVMAVAGRLFEAVGLPFGSGQRVGAGRLIRMHGLLPRKPPLEAAVRERLVQSVDAGTRAKHEALRSWSIR